MRRNATYLVATSLILAVCGCALFQKKESAQAGPALGSLDGYTQTIQEPFYAPTESYPAYPVTAAVADASKRQDIDLSPDMGLTQFHMVTKGDTLYALARRYYSDQRRWKDIYQANLDQIRNPNSIHVGQRLLIP